MKGETWKAKKTCNMLFLLYMYVKSKSVKLRLPLIYLPDSPVVSRLNCERTHYVQLERGQGHASI